MQTNNVLDCDDHEEALREGRPLRRAHSYQILFAQGDLKFQTLTLLDPVPLGRQILEAADLKVDAGYSLFGILPSGDFEDVRLNEPFDLRQKAAECFVAFLTDRTFKLTLDDAQIKWGEPIIKGAALYTLAKLSDDEAVFLEVQGGNDRQIDPEESINLTEPGIEQFITALKVAVTFEIIVNSRSIKVPDRMVTFEQAVQLAFPGAHAIEVVFSITYRHASSKPHAGELGKGGVVDVKQVGTVFNVTRTVQS